MYLCSKNEKIFQKRGLKIQVYSQNYSTTS